MTSTSRAGLPPIPAVLIAIVSVQGGAAIAKGLFPAIGAAGTAGLRIGISALMLLAVFRPPLRRYSAAQWRGLIPYGVVLGAMNLLFYLSLSRVPLGLAVTLEFVGPLTVAVLGSHRAIDLLWVALAGAGIALIAPWGTHGVDPVGAALALAAGGCWAAYIVLGGRLSQRVPGGDAVATGMLIATAVIGPFTLLGGGLSRLTPALLVLGVFVALLSSALPYTFEMIALRAMPARTFSIFMSLEPAVAALCGLAFLGERLGGTQWVSVMLVIVASAGAAMTSRASQHATP